MKKMIAVFVLACTFTAASANITASTTIAEKSMAFTQPFNQSYALEGQYLWFTDEDLTNPTGSYCDIFYEINRLSSYYPGYLFSHVPYGNLTNFEYGVGVPWLYATIYSDLKR
ncbi:MULTISPECIES: hypothetical protein [Niastella]|uniref:Uncharacterized protein n=1 Tax=Niastella soli TaxID=2821487 RepID=A0ABS3Z4R0_9BACT|nr:hypothetical protein [Niastella soli]MBO9205155.1 hypothetical protein [Niastella soli]